MTTRDSEIIKNSLRDGNLQILQPKNGYRFSVDALLLADFVRLKPADRVIDLGAGCGIVALMLARKFPKAMITAVEIQSQLAELAAHNIELNDMASNISVLNEDMNDIPALFSAGTFDHVVSNPPYRPPNTGRLCKNRQEAVARHEILTDLPRLLQTARHVLRPGGRISLIYSAERTAVLMAEMRKMRLEPKRLKMMHPDTASPARMVMVEGCKDAGEELHVLPPLFMT